MPLPMLCLDAEVRQCAEPCRAVLSKPQEESFVTVLVGLLECEGRRTLSGMMSNVAQPPSLSGVSRFLSESPWMAQALVVIWQEHFRPEMEPVGEAEREQQRPGQSQRTLGDRVSDGGCFDREEAERTPNGGPGQASLDDP
ncbi:MAG TPA: hypothetical protein VGF67_18145 [Ktedonobacteraceae bacterium]|jgi:hypothetical protein